jgi:hypothetical protein
LRRLLADHATFGTIDADPPAMLFGAADAVPMLFPRER